jgi:cytochrome P450
LVADIQQRSNVPAAGVPVLDFDPYSDEVLTDPYEHYRLLRETGPLVWLQKYGVYASGRYETVMRVLNDPQVF